MRPWMFNCKEVSLKVSESLDRKLPMVQRLMIRAHQLICRCCSRFDRQILLLRSMAQYNQPLGPTTDDAAALSQEARERIKKALATASPGAA